MDMLFDWLRPYISEDDVHLDKDEFLLMVADRIREDVPDEGRS